MHHDVGQIDQYPFAEFLSFDTENLGPGRLRLLDYVIRNRSDMAIGSTARDHHEIGDRRQTADFERQHIDGLAVVCRLLDQLYQFFALHENETPCPTGQHATPTDSPARSHSTHITTMSLDQLCDPVGQQVCSALTGRDARANRG